MSVREVIAQNIADTIGNITSPVDINVVTREPFDFDKLSNAQFPAVLIRTTAEDRNDSTLGGSNTQRMATLNFELVCYVKSIQIDSARNLIAEAIEEALDVDRTRNGNALDTQVLSIEVDEGSIRPIGGILITLQVLYSYQRGTT
tara:strand:+ start:2779 stop:3213 length:435 start_codon:yes stop_codon:yes gene_type:complete